MNKLVIARSSALIGYFGLLLLIILWSLFPTQLDRSSTSVVLVFAGLPLLLGLHGILHKKPYTHVMISIISLGYLIHGIVELWSQPDNRLFACAEILLSSFLYLGAGFYARYRSQELKAAASDHP